VGLRPRLLAALVLVAAVTLGVAALALLGPLQERLREQTADTTLAAARTARPAIERALEEGRSPAPEVARLERQADARVRVVPDVVPAGGPPTPALVLETLREQRTNVVQGDDGLQAALYLRVDAEPDLGRDAALLVDKRFTGVAAAVAEVRRAFLTAALAGLAIAALLAYAISERLLRRLERLRQAALRQEPAPYDAARDEVGDLARAMASMQEGLRRQEAARRAFVATASHELRTPLTSIRMNLELLDDDLREGRVDAGEAHEQIDRAQRQLGRLEHLATDLLDLSRLDAEVALRSEPVELGELARAVGAEFERRAGERGVRLEVVPPRGPCWGRGDANAVARITRILLDNALRFAPRDTPVRVVAEYHGPNATLAVADAGPGVPEAERQRIFERFQRGTSTGGEGGFGLGLAIGRELAERLGGRLDLVPAEPGAPGETRFVLSLPIELPAGSHPRVERGAALS
jgi:signal transduction histidine kinase